MTTSLMMLLPSATVVIAARIFLHRWTLPQPSLGTIDVADVAFTLRCVVAIPYLCGCPPDWWTRC